MRSLGFLVVALLSCFVTAEWYSSLGHMEDLVDEEMRLVSSLREYISAEEAKLEKIRDIANDLKTNADEAKQNIDKYLGHPVNQYLLVKRLKQEWDNMENLITKNMSTEFLVDLMEKRSILPSDEDVEGTAKAIMRLQDTYELDTHELAEGIIKNSSAGRTLLADDCFNIGRVAYLEKDYYHCALWMREADHKILAGDDSHDRFEVLDHLAFALSQQGNWQRAFDITKEMLVINPDHERIRGNHQYYKTILTSKKKGDDGEVMVETYGEPVLTRQMDQLPERHLYERLCREGSDAIPPRIEKRLKCYMWDNNRNPLLLLQPLKMEELWTSPHAVRFYNIVSEFEINAIKAMAKPRLNRATVQNPVTGVLEHAPYRVSKSAWLTDDESDVVRRVSNRIEAITGLSMETAEELQIANYGVGGQYEPHYDFARRKEKGTFEKEMGNRIATMLFYLTDVEYGGATIFLVPRIAIHPIKGSAVFWYNLYPSGEGDMRTRHAACPVLTGVKWVANKWIHERNQEFRRTCGLKEKADNRIF